MAGTTVLASRVNRIKMLVKVLDTRLPMFVFIPNLRALDLRNLSLRIFDLVVFSVSIFTTPISATQGPAAPPLLISEMSDALGSTSAMTVPTRPSAKRRWNSNYLTS
jgi:hypothetical protein